MATEDRNIEVIKKAFPAGTKKYDIETLDGMLAFTKSIKDTFLYAQNGLRFELRWSKAFPPVHLQQGKVVERLALQIVHWLETGDVTSETKIHIPFEEDGEDDLTEEELNEMLAEDPDVDDLTDEQLEEMLVEDKGVGDFTEEEIKEMLAEDPDMDDLTDEQLEEMLAEDPEE